MRGESPLQNLPPEILEKIFKFFASNIKQLKHLSDTCRKFADVIRKIHIRVSIPLEEELIRWLHTTSLRLHSLTNKEIAAYIQDQIGPLNIDTLKTARLVSFDYQSRKCEVTRHYWMLLLHFSRHCSVSLRRLELNADLAPGIKLFRFADLITSFKNLQRLCIHFSAHIELNQRILHSNDAQKLIDVILAELPHLKVLNIYTFPPVRISLESPGLIEFGLFKSELTSIVQLKTPALRRLNVGEDFKKLLLSNLHQERLTSYSSVHRTLLPVVYSGAQIVEWVRWTLR